MSEENIKTPEENQQPKEAQQEPPAIPESFWLKLVHQPLCKITGECNNCGRCEH